MRRYVPTDKEFEEAFSNARIPHAHLARYCLRPLEKTLKNDPQPEYVAIQLAHDREQEEGREDHEMHGTLHHMSATCS